MKNGYQPNYNIKNPKPPKSGSNAVKDNKTNLMNWIDCIHQECDMEGCHCTIGKGTYYNYCILYGTTSTCPYFKHKDSAKK